MHVGFAACDEGDDAGSSVCEDRVDAVGDVWTTPVRALALGSCRVRICFRAFGGIKVARVSYLYSYSDLWQADGAQCDPTEQQPPPGNKGHAIASRGHAAAADPTKWEQ